MSVQRTSRLALIAAALTPLLLTSAGYQRTLLHAATSTAAVARGGSPVNLRTAYRDSHSPDGARDFVGFRCAKPATSGKH